MEFQHLKAANLFDVEGRVAVVTGGGTGLGFIMAATLVTNGAKVYITGRRADTLQAAATKLNAIREGSAIGVPTDVTSQDSIQNLIKIISKNHSSLDILFANAGVLMKNATYAAPGLSLQETYEALSSGTDQLWDDTLKTNVTSVYSTVVAFMPLLAEAAKKGQGRGSVVLTGSVAGIHWSNEVDTLAYQASKAAVHHLTLTLSVKLVPFGIRVNCIAPGIFPSGMVDMNNTASPLVKAIHTSVPLKRAGKDTDLAGVVLLLASEAGAFIIGRTIPVDGGRLLTAHG